MILITKGGLSRGGDNEIPENCLYDCRLRDTCIYVPRWADEETLLRIGTERSKSCPLVQVYEVPKETEQAHTVMFDRKTENSSEKPNNCEPQTEVETMSCAECKHRPIGAEICEEACHYEPQTDWHYDEQDATWYPYKHEDEPQQKSCATCKHALGNWDGESNNCGRCCGADRRFYEPKDEPQTELVNDSPILVKDLVDDEFNSYDEECMRCKHLKLKCEFIPTYCKFESRYEPKDEPQTDCAWGKDE